MTPKVGEKKGRIQQQQNTIFALLSMRCNFGVERAKPIETRRVSPRRLTRVRIIAGRRFSIFLSLSLSNTNCEIYQNVCV